MYDVHQINCSPLSLIGSETFSITLEQLYHCTSQQEIGYSVSPSKQHRTQLSPLKGNYTFFHPLENACKKCGTWIVLCRSWVLCYSSYLYLRVEWTKSYWSNLGCEIMEFNNASEMFILSKALILWIKIAAY